MDPAALRTTDVDELIQGRYPSPGRLTARWQLVEILLAEFSDRHLSVDVTAHQLNDIDFSLACVDVPSHLGLNQLLRDDPRIGFPPDQGMQVGYTRGRLITERAAAYPAAVDRISEPDRRDIVRRLAEWFAAGPPWSDHASSGLDLIAMFGDRPTTV